MSSSNRLKWFSNFLYSLWRRKIKGKYLRKVSTQRKDRSIGDVTLMMWNGQVVKYPWGCIVTLSTSLAKCLHPHWPLQYSFYPHFQLSTVQPALLAFSTLTLISSRLPTFASHKPTIRKYFYIFGPNAFFMEYLSSFEVFVVSGSSNSVFKIRKRKRSDKTVWKLKMT